MMSLERKNRRPSSHGCVENPKSHFHKLISYFISPLMDLFLSLIQTKSDKFNKSISSFLCGRSKALKLGHQDYKQFTAMLTYLPHFKRVLQIRPSTNDFHPLEFSHILVF